MLRLLTSVVKSSLARLIQTGVYNRGGGRAAREQPGGGRKLCEGQPWKREGQPNRPGLPLWHQLPVAANDSWTTTKEDVKSEKAEVAKNKKTRQTWKSRETTWRGENKEQEAHGQRRGERGLDRGSAVRGTCSRWDHPLMLAVIKFTTETNCVHTSVQQGTHCALHPSNPSFEPASSRPGPASNLLHPGRPGCCKAGPVLPDVCPGQRRNGESDLWSSASAHSFIMFGEMYIFSPFKYI